MNKELLKDFMDDYGDKQYHLADYLGISRITLCHKLNGVYDFQLWEVEGIAKRYKLSPEWICRIFLDMEDKK